jgi:hypothetical protein
MRSDALTPWMPPPGLGRRFTAMLPEWFAFTVATSKDGNSCARRMPAATTTTLNSVVIIFQFSEGCSRCWMIRNSTGPFRDSSFRPRS